MKQSWLQQVGVGVQPWNGTFHGDARPPELRDFPTGKNHVQSGIPVPRPFLSPLIPDVKDTLFTNCCPPLPGGGSSDRAAGVEALITRRRSSQVA